jgi:hypothetical protein
MNAPRLADVEIHKSSKVPVFKKVLQVQGDHGLANRILKFRRRWRSKA